MTTRIRLTLEPTPNNDPGAGILIVSKQWEGAQENLQLTIQRNDTLYLQDTKDEATPWAGTPCNFTLAKLELIDGKLQALVGANLIDPLVNSARTSPNHQIELSDQHGYRATGGLVIKEAPLPSIAGGSSNKDEQKAVVDTPDIPVQNAVPEAKPETPVQINVEPEPAPTIAVQPPVAEAVAQPTAKKSRLLPLLIVLALIVAALIAAWLWFSAKAPSTAAPETPVATTPSSNTCDLSHMAGQSDLEFIQQCLKDNPDSASILATIQEAKANQHCSIAQRLYANRSQAGDMLIATAYVKEYDPKYHEASECFKEPNEATARYWYETILQGDPENVEAQTRLTELSQ